VEFGIEAAEIAWKISIWQTRSSAFWGGTEVWDSTDLNLAGSSSVLLDLRE